MDQMLVRHASARHIRVRSCRPISQLPQPLDHSLGIGRFGVACEGWYAYWEVEVKNLNHRSLASTLVHQLVVIEGYHAVRYACSLRSGLPEAFNIGEGQTITPINPFKL